MSINELLHQALPIINEWPTLSSGAKIGEIIKVLLEIGGLWEVIKFLDRRLFKRRSRLELKNELLEEEVRDNKSRIQVLNRSFVEAKERLPETAIARAEREWRDRNDDSAIRELESWFKENSDMLKCVRFLKIEQKPNQQQETS